MSDKEQETTPPAQAPAAGAGTAVVASEIRRDTTTAAAGVIAGDGSTVNVTINQDAGQTTRPPAQASGQRRAAGATQPRSTTTINNHYYNVESSGDPQNAGIASYGTPPTAAYGTPSNGRTGASTRGYQGRGDGSDSFTYPQGDVRNPLNIDVPIMAHISEPYELEDGRVARQFTADGARVIFSQRTEVTNSTAAGSLMESPVGSFTVDYFVRGQDGEYRNVMQTRTDEGGVSTTRVNRTTGATDRMVADPDDPVWGPWVGIDIGNDNTVFNTDRWTSTSLATVDHVTRDAIQDFFIGRPTLANMIRQSEYPLVNIGGQPTDLEHTQSVPARMEFVDNPSDFGSSTFTGHVDRGIIKQK